MDISSLPILFHVDPSDGLCTFTTTDMDFIDQSDIDLSDNAFLISSPGSGLHSYHVPSTTSYTSGSSKTDNTDDTAYIVDDDSQDSFKLSPTDEMEVTLFKNTEDMCDNLRVILGMPDMCDVTFLVGKNKEPVYGVKAILATRNKFFYKIIVSHQNSASTKKDQSTSLVTKKKSFWSRIFRFRRKGSYRRMKTTATPQERKKLEIQVEDFDADIFRRVIIYLHSGSVNVDINSAIGVMNAADIYGIPCLRAACFEFAQNYITLKTVLPLLISTETYSQFKWTRKLAQMILDFICEMAEYVLTLPHFENLPKSTAVMILLRPDLRARAETKWDTALKWSRQYCQNKGNSFFRRTVKIFTHRINFQDIPAPKLEKEVRPLGILSDDVIDLAIGCQVIPRSVIGQESRSTVAPPKPPRRKQVPEKFRRSAVYNAATMAPLPRGLVSINSESHQLSRRSCILDHAFLSSIVMI